MQSRHLRAAAGGAVGGALATAAMSVFMLGAKKVGALGEPPPRKITRAALRLLGAMPLRRRKTNAAALAMHFAFGVTMGALFGVARNQISVVHPIPPVAQGVLFGGLVWTASYVGWVPALGIMPPPKRDRPGRPTSMLLAHGVFGAVLGASARLLERPLSVSSHESSPRE